MKNNIPEIRNQLEQAFKIYQNNFNSDANWYYFANSIKATLNFFIDIIKNQYNDNVGLKTVSCKILLYKKKRLKNYYGGVMLLKVKPN